MATDRINDPRAFRDFLDAKLAHVGTPLTLDEALGLWEHENTPDEEREATVEAIRRGLEDADAGRTRAAGDVLRDLRRKHGLPDPS